MQKNRQERKDIRSQAGITDIQQTVRTANISHTAGTLSVRVSALILSLAMMAGSIMYAPLTVNADVGVGAGAGANAGGISGPQVDAVAIDGARAASRAAVPAYDWPDGAMAVDLYMDGARVLADGCAEINGVIYVPVERFVNLCGSFCVEYSPSPETVTVTGNNLVLTARVGDAYLTVNGRVLYTGAGILSLRGWIFAPLSSMATAMGASLTVRNGWYQAYLISGDPTAVPSATQTYNSTDLYWLSRIISAEARGEPFEGQIAVGNVVLNRVRSSEFPNTVKGVIFDSTYGIQFSPVANGTIYNTPTESAVMAAKVCLEGYSLSDRALYFFNPALATSSWIRRTRTYLFTIGGHAFYA